MARNAAAQEDKKPILQTQPELFEVKDPEVEEQEDDVQPGEKKAEKKDEPQDTTEALKAQIAALQESEKLVKETAERQRAEWERRQQELEGKLAQSATSVEEARLETLDTALTSANTEAESATRDLELAIEQGNPKGQADAQRRLSTAVAHIARLEDGKVELEAQIEAAKKQAKEPPTSKNDDPIERMNLPSQAKDWLRQHPEYASDPRKNIKVQALHWDVVEEGHTPFSTDYFVSLETKLGMRKPIEKPENQDEEGGVVTKQPTRKAPIVSAPVSREVPNGGTPRSRTRVELSPAEKEHARAAGITEAEYAKQKLRLQDLKAEGHYGDR